MSSGITLVRLPTFVTLLPKLSDLRQKCFENEIQIFHFFSRILVRNIIHSNKFSVSHNLEAHRNVCMSAYSIGFCCVFCGRRPRPWFRTSKKECNVNCFDFFFFSCRIS